MDVLQIIDAHVDPHMLEVKTMFEEYAASLEVSLDFQGFDNELATLPGDYAPPRGCLLLALWDGNGAGCVALRPMQDSTCEMKRLYVRPAFRGLKIGRTLAEMVIQRARELGYDKMQLDTLPSMKQAQAMYASLGFQMIPPYRYNPIEGTSLNSNR